MAEANFIQEGIDRVESAFENLEKEYKRLSKRAEKRRKEFEKQAERRIKRLQTELRKNPVVKRAEALRDDARKAAQEQVETVLGSLSIATRGEVRRLDRKVSQLSRKIRELEEKKPAARRATATSA